MTTRAKALVGFVILVAGAVVVSACSATVGPPAAGVGGVQWISGTAAANHVPLGTGDLVPYTAKSSPEERAAGTQWVQLSAGKANSLDSVVVNAAGRTLYRFNNDTANPAKSSCSGICAETWQPVVVAPGGRVFLDGVEQSVVGLAKREDGTSQVTIGGWPVYRYVNDRKAGDANGQGVGEKWFGVRPDGERAIRQGPGPGGPSATNQAGAKDSVMLFGDKDFSPNGGGEGKGGPGCRNVDMPGTASSLRIRGGPIKIWSGPDCTGRSAEVTKDIADLSTIGFDKKIVSVKFGVGAS